MKIDEALSTKPFSIIGHRGAKGVKPENTVSSIKYALDVGVDIVEVDIRRTKDNKLILLHDEDFKRLTGKDIKPSEVDFDFIKESLKIDGEPVATLDEALECVNGKACMFLEIKEPETTEDILTTILKHNALHWSAVISFYDEALVKAKKLLPSIKTGLIYFKPPGRIFDAKNINADIVLPYYKIASVKANNLAHRLGLKVAVWTVNDRETAVEVLERKPDAIASDYPDMLVKLRKELNSSSL